MEGEEYDVIVLGTGLKECILSGLMSTNKKKVLHVDRNDYYGGECASLNLDQLFAKFKKGQAVPTDMGRPRDYWVDLCPKFLMACGNLVRVLLLTKVTTYLEFKVVAGSYVYKGGKVHKVPSSASEALSSSLMGFFEKRRFKNFLEYVSNYDSKDPKTQKGYDIDKHTMKDIYDYWNLDKDTRSFAGHSLALQPDDSYLSRPARATFEAIKMYAFSMNRYGKSPYIYPNYGLGGLPEGFSRVCAIHGGVYMLNTPIDEILYDEQGAVRGVRSGKNEAKCKQLIADPSYFFGTDKVKKTHAIARAICLLKHTVPNTDNADSCQIILPYDQIGRKTDVYVFCVGGAQFGVAPEGYYVAVVSAEVEGAYDEAKAADAKQQEAVAQRELAAGLALLGKVEQVFMWVSDYYVPVNDPKKDQCFITSSYDSTSHFESATEEVLRMYEQIMGAKLDLTVKDEPKEDQ